MSYMVEERVESKRGCGYRRAGGIYLTFKGMMQGCGKMPIPLTVCPCCGAGIKPARGWTWIDGKALSSTRKCTYPENACNCPLSDSYNLGRVGLLWVGEKFYATPGDFTKEAMRMGISRRIHTVPKGFKVGETWVFLAHRHTIVNSDGTFTPAVFQVFRPTAIEYVVKDNDSKKKLEALSKRGLTLVKVTRDVDTVPLLDGAR